MTAQTQTTPMGASHVPILLTGGLIISQSIYVAARLGIPDLLADGPKTVEELARQTTSHAPSLLRVLRLLAPWPCSSAREKAPSGSPRWGSDFAPVCPDLSGI